MKNLIYIISTLVITAICAGAGSIVKTERLETRVNAIEKDSEKIDSMILMKLDKIESKLDNIIINRE